MRCIKFNTSLSVAKIEREEPKIVKAISPFLTGGPSIICTSIVNDGSYFLKIRTAKSTPARIPSSLTNKVALPFAYSGTHAKLE